MRSQHAHPSEPQLVVEDDRRWTDNYGLLVAELHEQYFGYQEPAPVSPPPCPDHSDAICRPSAFNDAWTQGVVGVQFLIGVVCAETMRHASCSFTTT